MAKFSAWIGSILVLLLASDAALAQGPSPTTNERKQQTVNQITVSIVVSGMQCTCARFAEDIRNVVNDLSPNGVRVLPILGVGGIQNIQDLLFLKGIDMGTVDQDHIEYLKAQDPTLYADLEQRIHYVTKLYNSEFHVAARKAFKRLSDLQGRKVSFNLENSHSHIAAERLFDMIGLQTQKVFYDDDAALQLLKAGELDAHIVLTGAPQSGLSRLASTDGVRLLPLREDDLPDARRDELYRRYLPADLTYQHYPDLIEPGETVPTIATRTALAVYNWEEGSFRYRKIQRFVHEFFSQIDRFNNASRHPKWAEVNLAAKIPGWNRFKPAQEWLDHYGKTPRRRADQRSVESPALRRTSNVAERDSAYRANSGRLENDRLYVQFQQFLKAQQTRAEN